MLDLANRFDLARNTSAREIVINSNLNRAADLPHHLTQPMEGNCLDGAAAKHMTDRCKRQNTYE